MGRPQKSASCTDGTDGRASLPHACSLAIASPKVLAEIATLLGANAPSLDACGAALRDEAAMRARLARVPMLTVVALEALLDTGGEADVELLRKEVARRTGLAQPVPAPLIEVCMATGAAVLLRTSRWGRPWESLAIVEEALPVVARIARGLTLPRRAPPPDSLGHAHRKVRDMVALSTLALHRQLRLTMDRSIHRASAKSFAKGLGIEAELCIELLERRATWARVVTRDPKVGSVGVSLPGLEAVTRGRPTSRLDEQIAAMLPEGRWVSLEALARAIELLEIARRAEDDYAKPYEEYALAATASEVLCSPAISVLEHEGATWVRRRAIGGGGDGHVTPSFEVMLGPAADLGVVAAVGLGAELVRVDQVLTFRIGPKSVQAGIVAGMDPAAFVDALARVGRHGLPDNVRAMVDDWAGNARVAAAEAAVVLRVPERAEDSAVKALGAACLGRLAPGRLVVSPREWEAALKKLRAAGFSVATLGELPVLHEVPVAEHDDASDHEPAPVREPLLPPWPDGDPAMVARYEAAKARGFRDDLSRAAAAAPKPAPAPPPARPAAPSAPPQPPPQLANDRVLDKALLGRAAALGASLFAACRADIEAWIATLPPGEREVASRACDYPLLWAPLSALLPEYRARALRHKKTLVDAYSEAWRLGGGGRRSQRGVELMRAAEDAWFDREAFWDLIEALYEDDSDALEPFAAPKIPAQPAAERPAAPAKPQPQGLPVTRSIATHPDAVRKRMIRAHQDERPVRIRVGQRESVVLVTAVRTRGKETMFLVVDVETDQGHALPLESIAAASLEDAPLPAGQDAV